MSTWARPGVKVVCVDGKDHDAAPGHAPLYGYPVEGRIYTISRMIDHPLGGISVRLAELTNPAFIDGEDYGFGLFRFRPLVTRTQEQDLAIFRPLLTDLPVKVDA